MRAGLQPPSPQPRYLAGQRQVAVVFRTPSPGALRPGLPLPASAPGSAVIAASYPRLAQRSFQQQGGDTESRLLRTRGSCRDASARGCFQGCREGAGRVDSPRWVWGSERVGLGTPRPGCAWPPLWATRGKRREKRLHWTGGVDTTVWQGPGVGQDQLPPLCGLGQDALTKSESEALPSPLYPGTSTRGQD